jgi:hypothetical protein
MRTMSCYVKKYKLSSTEMKQPLMDNNIKHSMLNTREIAELLIGKGILKNEDIFNYDVQKSEKVIEIKEYKR